MTEDAESKDPTIPLVDIVVYAGGVYYDGYYALTQEIETNRTPDAKHCYFIMRTYGGDPDAGFRIARALGHYYPEGVTMMVPSFCKSTGTLIAIGAKELVIFDSGELGPLDIQLQNRDEAFEMSSGLDIVQSLSMLQDQMLASFRNYLMDIKMGAGLGTKLASEIASKMAAGTLAPIAGQIDPGRLGEHQRALNIAMAYGDRLNKKFRNTNSDNIGHLLAGYPSHSFVIDRKEAALLFDNVRAPTASEQQICAVAYDPVLRASANLRHSEAQCQVRSLKSVIDEITESLSGEEGNEEQAAVDTGNANIEESSEAAGGDVFELSEGAQEIPVDESADSARDVNPAANE